MKIYGNQIMQAVVFILEGEHVAEIKEQVSCVFLVCIAFWIIV